MSEKLEKPLSGGRRLVFNYLRQCTSRYVYVTIDVCVMQSVNVRFDLLTLPSETEKSNGGEGHIMLSVLF